MKEEHYIARDAQGIAKTALVTALYVTLTMIVSPISFGPIQFRISEGLNYLGLFHKRYVTAISLGVIIVNAMFSTPLDVIVGTFHTVISLLIARFLADKMGTLFKKERLARFITMAVVFSLTMFIIAWMLYYIEAVPFFWETYLTLAISELIAMILGGLIVYPLSLRIDFNQ